MQNFLLAGFIVNHFVYIFKQRALVKLRKSCFLWLLTLTESVKL